MLGQWSYGGDPSLLAPAAALLRNGLPLRVLALSTNAGWPAALLGQLNSTFPGRQHSVTALTLADVVSGASCAALAMAPRLLASVDLFILEPGHHSSAHYGDLIGAAEDVLRAALLGMARPSALLLVPQRSAGSWASSAEAGSSREATTLHSPAHALTLLAQFYGVPVAWDGAMVRNGASRGASRSKADGELATLAMALLRERAVEVEHASSPALASSVAASPTAVPPTAAAGLWAMPSQRMVRFEAAAERPHTTSAATCPPVARAAVVCARWLASSPTRLECAHRLRREAPSSSSSAGSRLVETAQAQGASLPAAALGRLALKSVRSTPARPGNAKSHALGPCQAGPGGITNEAACSAWSVDKASALLPPGLLARTRAHEGSTEAWARVVARLDAGKSVSVSVLGGSMSLPQRHGWSESVLAWMRSKWPRAEISLHNGAIGATGSTFFALCADSRLPARADIILLEHTLNDGEQTAVVDASSLKVRALVYESYVRKLLARSPSPALLFVNWDRIGWCANMESNPEIYVQRYLQGPLRALRGIPWLATPQVAVDLIARWYGIPSLAPRNALWHRDCDDLNFRGAFCDRGGVMGCGHLSPLGYEVIAQVVSTYIADVAARVHRRQRRPRAEAAMSGGVPGVDGHDATALDAPPIPPPLFAEVPLRSESNGRCLRGDEMRQMHSRVVHGDWSFVRRDPRQPAGADKPGYLSLLAPSALELEVGATPAGVVALGFLRSYDERMGELHVHCVKGCKCNATSLVGWHARRSSVMAFGMIGTSPSNACTLRLTHRARGAAGRATAGSRSKVAITASNSSKFKLIAVVVPPFSLDGSDRDLQQARGFNS